MTLVREKTPPRLAYQIHNLNTSLWPKWARQAQENEEIHVWACGLAFSAIPLSFFKEDNGKLLLGSWIFSTHPNDSVDLEFTWLSKEDFDKDYEIVNP